MKTIHNIGDIFKGYRITGLLGQGGIATTYAAEDIESKQKFAIKVISLKTIDNFKMLELFEREAKILSQLDRFDIPKYIGFFQVDRPRYRLFYIVQQLAEGENLADLIEKGWKPSELEVKQIAARILEILIYLQQLIPPVIHRDIKPQNIIHNQSVDFREKDKLFLVDFGAVQDTYHNSLTGGSTIVGTYGYMAPEQFRGQAKLSTDLYGLGSTLIFLLTHQHPSELPQRKLKIDWRSKVKQGKLDKHFETWLDRTIEPAIEDRFNSAEESLATLHRGRTYTRSRNSRSVNSKISIIENENKQVISISPVLLQSNYSRFFVAIPIIWILFSSFFLWIAFLDPQATVDYCFTSIRNTFSLDSAYSIFRIFEIISLVIYSQALSYATRGKFDYIPYEYSDYFKNLFPVVFFIIYLGIGLQIIYLFLIAYASEMHIEIDANSILFRRKVFGWRIQNTRVIGQIGEALQANLKNTSLSIKRGSSITVCNLTVKRRNIRFGSFFSEEEKKWLIDEIKDFVERQNLKLEDS